MGRGEMVSETSPGSFCTSLLCQQSLPVLGLLGSSGFQQISGLYWQPKAAEDLLELLSEHMSSVSSHELQDSSSDSQVLILQILSVAPALH